MRSRAVNLPLACCFSTARSEAGVRRLVDTALQVRELPRGRVNVDLFRLGHRDVAPCLLMGT